MPPPLVSDGASPSTHNIEAICSAKKSSDRGLEAIGARTPDLSGKKTWATVSGFSVFLRLSCGGFMSVSGSGRSGIHGARDAVAGAAGDRGLVDTAHHFQGSIVVAADSTERGAPNRESS